MSGRMVVCHAGGPGLNPGYCNSFLIHNFENIEWKKWILLICLMSLNNYIPNLFAYLTFRWNKRKAFLNNCFNKTFQILTKASCTSRIEWESETVPEKSLTSRWIWRSRSNRHNNLSSSNDPARIRTMTTTTTSAASPTTTASCVQYRCRGDTHSARSRSRAARVTGLEPRPQMMFSRWPIAFIWHLFQKVWPFWKCKLNILFFWQTVLRLRFKLGSISPTFYM